MKLATQPIINLAALALGALVLAVPLACGGGDEGLSRTDVEEVVRTELAEAPAPPMAEPGLTAAEVEAAVREAISVMVQPAPGLSEAQVEEMVQAAVASIPEPQPGITAAEVEAAVLAAVAAMVQPAPGLSEAQVEEMVQAAIASIPEPQSGVTAAEVEDAIRTAVLAMPAPEQGLSAEDVERIVQAALDRREAATPAPAGPAPTDREAIVEQLKRNADAFEYSIGRRGGSLTVATISEPLTFNLAIATDASSSGVLGYLFEGLTETSWLTDEVEPLLAESWERSADGLTWTFRLRDDVSWHDGEPFTARDVEFTFNRIIYSEDIRASAGPQFHFRFLDEESGEWRQEPMTVTAVDDYTVVCVLPAPFAPFLRYMGTAIYPRHILEDLVDDGTFSSAWSIDTDPAEIVGTGPFTIGLYTPGERVVMRRNPDYWLRDDAGNALPYLDEIVHVIVPDLDAELEWFLAGGSDVHGVLGEEYAMLEPLQGEGNFTIHRRGPTFGTTFLGFNMNPGADPETGEPYVAPEKLRWFQSAQFRRAVAYSIDKDAIIDDIQQGLGYPQWSSISPAAGDFHNPDVRRYEYDPDRANGILDGLGWTDTDGDGIREDDEGNEISFSMVTNTGNTVRSRVGSIVRRGMHEIGIGVDYRLVEFGEMVTQLTSSYDWEALIIGFTGGTDPHGGITLWHSGENLHLWHPNQSEPATEWEARIDELYVAASRELDRGRRVDLYHRAQEIVAENVPVIYTTLSERLSAVRNVFGNATPTLYALWDIRYLYRTE